MPGTALQTQNPLVIPHLLAHGSLDPPLRLLRQLVPLLLSQYPNRRNGLHLLRWLLHIRILMLQTQVPIRLGRNTRTNNHSKDGPSFANPLMREQTLVPLHRPAT
jgi:hypothetical protein